MHCSIIPPYLLRNIAERGTPEDRAIALASLELSSVPLAQRSAIALVAGPAAAADLPRDVAVYDAEQRRRLPGSLVRGERTPATRDRATDEAFAGAGRTWRYFHDLHARASIDAAGMRIVSTVHYGRAYCNAHWNGRQMIYGDGDGRYFHRFTASLDVIAHELTHGITQYSARFVYRSQSGALAEHFSDVFGVLVAQYARRQSAAEADWLIGAELLTRRVNGRAVRSMAAPGTAYDDPILGRDLQPAHMRDYLRTRDDDGGVHVNSGIPNHAFWRVAMSLGGNAWERPGAIWYRALTQHLGPRARFADCAAATIRAASELFGQRSAEESTVRDAWESVGVATPKRKRYVVPQFAPSRDGELLLA